jgi:DNA gyrase/topoisomerase IV subunit B
MTSIFPGRHGAVAKLDDCAAHGPRSGAELIVVEGDSAAEARTLSQEYARRIRQMLR